MSEEKLKEPKPRITSWIRTNFGEDILEEIRTGKRTIKLNETELDPKDKKFRDKRVTGTSKVEIIPIPVKNKTGLAPRDVLQEKEPEQKVYVKDYLTQGQVQSVTSGKANVFMDGLATTLDKEIQIDKDANPMVDGKPVVIKVLPQFAPG